MPSIKKAAKSPKAAASAEQRGQSAKSTRKPATSSKGARGKNARGKAETSATRKRAVRSDSSSTKGKTAKATSRKTVKSPMKSAAKTAGRIGAKKTVGAKKSSARKSALVKTTSNPASAKSKAKTVAKAAVGKQGSPTSRVPTKKAPALAQKSKAAAPAKKVAANKTQEKSIQSARPHDITALNPVVRPPAQSASVRPTETELTTPVASEAIQVAKNISDTAAKAVARKPAPPIAGAAPNDEKTAPAKIAAPPAKPVAPGIKPRAPSQKLGFKLSEFIVYPAHGVGQIIGIEVQEVAGFSLELFVVSFIKDKMILKVPTAKVTTVGMRKLAELEVVDKALSTLSGRARVKRTMWSRRAQEYEAKINSGDLVTIAEVVRDLYRSDTQPEQSYSERQLYEAALDRMAREIAAVRKLIDSEALKVIESFLLKGPRRGAKAEADLADDVSDEADVDRAA